VSGVSKYAPTPREFVALQELVEAHHPDLEPGEWGPEHFAAASAAAVRAFPFIARTVERERREVASGRPKAPKSKSEPAELKRARIIVYKRSGGYCEANTSACPSGTHQAEHVHHKQGRRHNAPSDLLHVCLLAHDYIHKNPAESYDAGWMVRRLGVS